ncbi:MAG TPA: TonB-dependent receptor, partial [Candidatus Acidoferrum sp.]|nr:TonB-dependent receptor [Candidatus Acidoferrum sp.]
TTGIDLSRESALLTGVASYDANGNASYVATSAAQAQSAAYAQYQYGTPNGARVVVGLRGEHDAPIGGVLSPSIGFALPLAPGTRLAFNASNAFRVPTIIDRYYPGFANPNLKPERSSDGDLTLETDRILGGAALTWFGREATNLIQTDPNNGFIPENIAKASIRGLQATIKTRPYHGFVTTLALTNTYRAVNLTPGMNATRLNFDPVFTTSLTLDHPLAGNRVGFGATANLYGPHQEASRVNPGWTTVDAYVRARVYQDAVLSVRVRNLGDERYVSFFGYPALGRTFALELATR